MGTSNLPEYEPVSGIRRNIGVHVLPHILKNGKPQEPGGSGFTG
jgi:hypothetical protein